MQFGEFIRLKRDKAKFSQNQVATWLGFAHRSNICLKEGGRLNWNLADILSLAELFNLKPSELMAEFEDVQNEA